MLRTRLEGLLLFASGVAAVLYSSRGVLQKAKKADKIEEKKPSEKASTIRDTVSPHSRHVVLCVSDDPESWISHLEQDLDSMLGQLFSIVGKEKSSGVKLTAAKMPDRYQTGTTVDVFVYPDNKMWKLTQANLEEFGDLLKQHSPLNSSSPHVHDIDFAVLMLVCAHGQRDKRCGRAGPQIIESLVAEINKHEDEECEGENETEEMEKLKGKQKYSAKDIIVAPSSHIGGHKYAGTLILYPRGDWYGQVTSRSKDAIGGIVQAATAELLYVSQCGQSRADGGDSGSETVWMERVEGDCHEPCMRGNTLLQW